MMHESDSPSSRRINRREFVLTGTAAGIAAAAQASPAAQAPAVARSRPRPVVISSANGNQFKNGGTMTCVEKAFALMTSGKDVLDALIAGVNIVELDPLETSVGYGGLPNADGVVQLDSCCMHGPRKRAGGVACIEGVRTPSLVAQAVMDKTDHHLIVGKDAQTFARNLGSRSKPISTPSSRARPGSNGSAAPTRRTISIHKRARRRCAASPGDDGRGLDRSRALLWHHQLQRHQRQGRDLRRDHDQRPGLEDSRAASATRRSSAPASTSTAPSAPPDRPAAARRTSTISARS